MLCGEPPFKGKDDASIIERVKNGPLEFRKPIWKNVTSSARELIEWMLERNVKKRPTCEQVIGHPWFSMLLEEKQSSVLSEEE